MLPLVCFQDLYIKIPKYIRYKMCVVLQNRSAVNSCVDKERSLAESESDNRYRI